MQIETLLKNYKPYDANEAAIVQQLHQFLAAGDNHYDRSNLIAHIVADAWIVDPARRNVVMVEHGLNKTWMAPGGHCDGSSDVIDAARREAEEEAGLTGLSLLLGGGIYDINSGNVPLRERQGVIEPAHVHFDICFAFEAPENAPLKISDESSNLRWIAVEDLDRIDYWPSHKRRIDKMRAGILNEKSRRHA